MHQTVRQGHVRAEDLGAIAAALLAKAKQGDVAAAKLVLAYAIGRPEATVDPDRLDIDEWQNFKEGAGMMGDLPDLLQRPDPDLPLTILRAARPGVTSGLSRLVNQTLGRARAGKRHGRGTVTVSRPV